MYLSYATEATAVFCEDFLPLKSFLPLEHRITTASILTWTAKAEIVYQSAESCNNRHKRLQHPVMCTFTLFIITTVFLHQIYPFFICFSNSTRNLEKKKSCFGPVVWWHQSFSSLSDSRCIYVCYSVTTHSIDIVTLKIILYISG